LGNPLAVREAFESSRHLSSRDLFTEVRQKQNDHPTEQGMISLVCVGVEASTSQINGKGHTITQYMIIREYLPENCSDGKLHLNFGQSTPYVASNVSTDLCSRIELERLL
jgi:hypothetical protein